VIARALSLMRPSIIASLLRKETDLSTPAARGRDRQRRIALSAAASMAAKLVTIAASLISIPLTLHYLGPERYGIWLIISSFTVMLSFADMGLGNGVLNAVSREHGRDDREAIRKVVSSGYLMLSVMAVIILIILAISYPLVSWEKITNVHSPLAVAESGPAFAVFIAFFALAVPISLVQKVQFGLQESFIVSLWQCVGNFFGLLCLLLVIKFQGGLPWLVAALVGIPQIAAILNNIIFFRTKGRDISPRLSLVSRTVVIATVKTGLLFFVLQLVVSFAYGADSIIIAQYAGAVAVPQYAVPERMFSLISMVLGMVMTPLWPAYGEAIVRGDHAWVGSALKKAILAATVISGVCSLTLVFIGPAIIRLWVGPQIKTSLALLTGLALWKVIETSSSAIAVFLNGAEMLRFQIVIATISGLGMIALKIYLVKQIGVAGIPWAACAAFVPLAAIPTWVTVYRWLAHSKKMQLSEGAVARVAQNY